MKNEYDYLVVGSGLFGSVFAHEAKKAGKKCLIIDKRNHTGGNIYCEKIEDINVHKYGPHIFHTNDKKIWDYVNQFVDFNHFVYSPLSLSKGKFYNLPFNMNTFYQLWETKTPKEAKEKIDVQIALYGVANPKNLEEQALSLVGKDIYETLIKGYTEKQWGRKASELPSFIIKRLPIRFTFDNNYFNDRYQGIPIGGYNKLTEALLKDIEVRLDTNYFENKEFFKNIATKIIFTGKIDEYFDYQYGKLEYRSLRFESEILDTENFQGNAGINYNDNDHNYTRIVEHKHFEFGNQKKTVITKEYSENWTSEKEAYYPINDEKNQAVYSNYKKLSENHNHVIFGGRLAEYKYYDMHQIIASALIKSKKELENG